MFIKELSLYIEYLREQLNETLEPDKKFVKYCTTFGNNLLQGIAYYQELFLTQKVVGSWKNLMERPLENARREIKEMLE